MGFEALDPLQAAGLACPGQQPCRTPQARRGAGQCQIPVAHDRACDLKEEADEHPNRLYRWGVSSGGLADHSELVSSTTREVALRKAQTVTVSQKFFEQSRDLATVTLVTAEGTVQVGMLPLPEAKALRDHIIRVVETDHRQWM